MSQIAFARRTRSTRLLSLTLAGLAVPAMLVACAGSETSTADGNANAAEARPAATAGEAASTATPATVVTSPVSVRFEYDDTILAMYREHITTLADPVVMTGRLPGTEGIENAARYIEDEFRSLGLEPAFPVIREVGESVIVGDDLSYRQPFEVNGGATLETESMTVRTPSGAVAVFEPREQYNVVGYGESGYAEGPLAFIGYSVEDGPDGYNSFEMVGRDGGTLEDLRGHIAMILRFEPHDEDGASTFVDAGWSGAAGLNGKFLNAVQRGAEGIIFVTPPGVDDPRADRLETIQTTGWSRPIVEIPVVHMRPDAADILLEAASARATMDDLIASANDPETPSARVFDRIDVAIDAEIDREPASTDNVGAILPGAGDLADEYIVIGAHYDHVGYGPYGSRVGPGQMHPGADDNASGTSGVLTAAALLSDLYEEMGDEPRRSVLFLLFSAEESGLNGSRYYVNNAIAATDDHHLMINLDMIGSYGDGQGVELGSIDSGHNLRDLFADAVEASELDARPDSGVGSGRSDHANFDRAGIPNIFLFTGITDEYHTPDDTLDTIDVDGAARIATMAANMTVAAATDPADIDHVDRSAPRVSLGGPMNIRVRVGIAPGTYAGEDGILVGQVYEGTSAELGGVEEGDKIVKWNGEDVTTVQAWMPMLAGHTPGDEVEIVVERDGEEQTLTLELQARRSDG
ncbi:MAG: M20/M25/M40 family metallo-hydrolase [Planctomycetota bacterium]